MITTTYGVTGLTCEHCVNAVTEEVFGISGVSDATVDLVPGGTSSLAVTSDEPVARDDLAAALTEAGEAYVLADD